ncbi:hypothetical protein EDB84DRAFT_1440761 [Lactarius hengduanensis]|nr:hypothetical protein EDB84DRAFT_1440761 [Lactarius hengduanensis]
MPRSGLMAAIVSHAPRHRALQTFHPDLAFLTARLHRSALPHGGATQYCEFRSVFGQTGHRRALLTRRCRLSGKKKRVGLERRVNIVHYGARSMVSFRCLWRRDGLRDVPVGHYLTPQKLGAGGVNSAHTCKINRHLPEDRQGPGRYSRKKRVGILRDRSQMNAQGAQDGHGTNRGAKVLSTSSSPTFVFSSTATRLGALLKLLLAVCPAGLNSTKCSDIENPTYTLSHTHISKIGGHVIIREDPDGDLLYAQHLVPTGFPWEVP